MPKQVNPCIFCGNLPCTCGGSAPQKKQARPRKKAEPSVTNTSVAELPSPAPTQSSAPGIDLKAAMKAAMPTSHRKVETVQLPSGSETIPGSDPSDDDPELIEALAVLEPILHTSEKERFNDILTSPRCRAAKWRLSDGNV